MVCAVGIAGPSPRLTPDRVRDDIERVHAAATHIAEALGLEVPAVSATRSPIGPPHPRAKKSEKKSEKKKERTAR